MGWKMKKSAQLKIGLLSCVGYAAIMGATAGAQTPGEVGENSAAAQSAAKFGPTLNLTGAPLALDDRNFFAENWPVREIRKGKVYYIPGGGDVSTVIIGDKGVIIVDPKTTRSSGEQLIKDVAALTPKPITHVIETHSDCDHVNGIVAFPASVQVIAHVNNRLEQEQVARLATVEINGGYGVAPQDRLPNVLIRKNGETATIDGVRLVFYHFGPGHTDGDLMTYLPDEKVLVAGDIMSVPGTTPERKESESMKFEKNGGSEGWIANAEGILATDADVIVTGHGQYAMSRADVKQRIADFKAKMAQVDALAASGMSLNDTIKAMGDRPVDPLANGLASKTLAKECPRGITAMSDSWIRWHEWHYVHDTLDKMGSK
jgi:cyclase